MSGQFFSQGDNVIDAICLFVWLGFFWSHSRFFSLIWRRHHYRWRATHFDICSALMTIEQGRFFKVPTPISRMRGELSTTTPPHWWHLNIFFRTTGPISTKLFEWRGCLLLQNLMAIFNSKRRKFINFSNQYTYAGTCTIMILLKLLELLSGELCDSHASCFWFSIMLPSFPLYGM